MRALLSCLLLLALAGCEPREEARPAAPRCGPETYGQPAYDALASDPRFFRTDTDWLEGPGGAQVLAKLRAAAMVEPALPVASRIALQNDVWGLWQRVDAAPVASVRKASVLEAAEALVRRLAPTLSDTPPGALPPPLGEGWRELESEMPVLNHERLFGFRRVFRVALRRGARERAIFSQLLAIDARGRVVRTSVFGDLEMLELDGDALVGARLFELDRRALRCGGPRLVEAATVAHVPGTGANGFLAELDPPAMLQALPCQRCHDDGEMMTLPSPTLPLGARHASLLELGRSRSPLRDISPPRDP